MNNLQDMDIDMQGNIKPMSAQALILDLLSWTTIKMIKEETHMSASTIYRIAHGKSKKPHAEHYKKILGLHCRFEMPANFDDFTNYADIRGE